MKQFLRAAVAATTVAFAAPAFATDIVVVSHGQANDPFWSVVKNGVEQAAKDTGVNVEYRSPETFDMVAMSQLIDAAVNQEPDGLVVSVPDADALGPSIKRAVAAGIPVITMNAGSDVSKSLGALLHVGQDEFTAGERAGEKLKEMGGKNGLCVNQEVGNVSLDQRCAGFAKGFGGQVKVLPTTNDPADIEAKVRALRQAIDSQISAGGRQCKLMIDGGIKSHNIALVRDWGIEVSVVGSGLINDTGTIAENLAEFDAALSE